MGVAGSGKTTVARLVAQAGGIALLEGDDFHAPESIAKMRQGTPLTDQDRERWLDRIGDALAAQPGAVVSCSALKRAYRDRLRARVAGLRFVFLEVSPAVAHARVAARGAGHFFPPSLVDLQFATLESPAGEPGVLRLDATRPEAQLCDQALAWRATHSKD
ncbi:gluconokinase [Ramlibacter aquaticus]|uniref:Gluconokinase n=2 Tax=Comamonadaceae TaxID=80864 RepID=A0ABR9SHR2_9BURK|nr:gluconokinase [Ramlibacter aquaticus]